jgi:hypothetical protein
LRSNDVINCEEILENRKESLLKKNEFNAEEEFERVVNSIRNKESFLYSIVSILNKNLEID